MPLDLIAADDFSGSDETKLVTYGAGNWALQDTSGDPAAVAVIKANKVEARFFAFGPALPGYRWTGAGTALGAHASEVIIGGFGTFGLDHLAGVQVFCSGANATWNSYAWYVDDDTAPNNSTTRLVKVVNGVPGAALDTRVIAWASGDKMRVLATPNASNPAHLDVKAYRNDALVFTHTDATPHTGAGWGLVMRGGTGTLNLDAFRAYNVTADGPVLSGAASLDDADGGGAMTSVPPSTMSGTATLDGPTASGGLAPALGTFTSEPLTRNNGTVAASSALDYVRWYDPVTGALVLEQTGLATNAGGIFTAVPAAQLVDGVVYAVDWKEATGQRRMPLKAAG